MQHVLWHTEEIERNLIDIRVPKFNYIYSISQLHHKYTAWSIPVKTRRRCGHAMLLHSD